MAMLMMPVAAPTKSKTQKWSDVFNVTVLKDANFVLFVIGNALHNSQIGVLYQLSTSRAVTKGMSKMQASYLPAMIGITSTISRFISSWISNMRCASHIGMYAASVCGMALSLIASCFKADDFVYVAICGVVSGIAMGRFLKIT